MTVVVVESELLIAPHGIDVVVLNKDIVKIEIRLRTMSLLWDRNMLWLL